MRFDLRLAPDALAALRTAASGKIDTAAETARLRFVTPGSAMQIVYYEKKTEAALFLATYADATAALAAVPTAWPFLAAELGITATTLFAVATTIGATAAQWIGIAAAIEAIRMAAKLQVTTAATGAAIDAVVAGLTWPQP
jgi:hypothetical protein